MAISADLFKAILAMDSYNRGYNAGITGLSGGPGAQIGNATVFDTKGDAAAQSVSFYGIAYTLSDGSKIIAYRGTDRLLFDVVSYPLALGDYNVEQARLAAQFYLSVADQAGINNVTLTGHSLGGGLAGFIGGLYGSAATLFDNMPFEDAIESFDSDIASGENSAWRAHFSSSNISPNPDPVKGNIDGYFVGGEFLVNARALAGQRNDLAQITFGEGIDLPGNDSAKLHSMSLLVLGLYAQALQNEAWKTASRYFLPQLFSDEIGQVVRAADRRGSGSLSDVLRDAIAYSAIDEGERPFGDTAIRALFDDATNLGEVLALENGSNLLKDGAEALARILVQYAGHLALRDVEQANVPEALSGVLQLTEDKTTLTIDASKQTWMRGEQQQGSAPKIIGRDELIENVLTDVLENGATAGTLADVMDRIWDDPQGERIETIVLSTLDTAITGPLPDAVEGAEEDTVVFYVSGDGDDTLQGSSKDDLIAGGGGVDTIVGNNGRDILAGGDGNDVLYGGEGDERDLLDGGEGDDFLWGMFGQDELYGGAGEDTLIATDGVSHLYGGEGNDRFVLSAVSTDSKQVEMIIEDAEAGDHLFVPYNFFNDSNGSFEGSMLMPLLGGFGPTNAAGTEWSFESPILTGTYPEPGPSGRTQWDFDWTNGVIKFVGIVFYTIDGSDLIITLEQGQAETRTYFVDLQHNFTETYTWTENYWGPEQTIIRIKNFEEGDLGIRFNESFSVPLHEVDAQYNASLNRILNNGVLTAALPELPEAEDANPAADSEDPEPGHPDPQIEIPTEWIVASSATGGDDDIAGGGGGDIIEAGDGNDVINPGAGADSVDGGAGTDTVVYSESPEAVTVDLGLGEALGGDAAGDVLINVEDIIGSAFGDALTGDDGNNVLIGLAGDDTFVGGRGIDRLKGGAGDDRLMGDEGRDLYFYAAGDGNDTIAESGLPTDIDVLILQDLNRSDISLARDPGNLDNLIITVLSGVGAGETITIEQQFSPRGRVERIQFADQSTLSWAELNQLLPLPPNTLPEVTSPATLSVTEDVTATGTLVATDADGDELAFAVKAGAAPAKGTVIVATNGDFAYTPNGNATGADTFTIVVSDGRGGTAEQVVAVMITPVNDAPVAAGDSGFSTDAGTTLVILASALLGNDSDIDGDALAITSVADAVGGAVALDGSGNVVFTPQAGYSGPASFRYTASDGNGGTATATAALTVALVGTEANDSLAGTAGADIIRGLGGADQITGGAGADLLDGGAGVDTALYTASSAGIDVDLTRATQAGGDADGDSLVFIENVTGSAFADIIRGDAGANYLTGLDGADTLDGRGGIDELHGANGSDILLGGDGNDKLFGENDNDIIYGDAGDDTLNGGAGLDVLHGGVGNDGFFGGGGDDTLYGEEGNDNIFGDGGNDRLVGGSGNDSLTGGANDDTFVFTPGFGLDTIQVFADSGTENDIIEFSTAIFADFAAVQAAMSQAGADVLITVSAAEKVTLKNVALANLAADDFRFVA